tara:strand:- start:10818 stop:11660 length:843 start_codon:yes stop_codon:yes gene_type:complete
MSAAITAAAIGATMSFTQQMTQNKRQRQAEADADKAMALARGKLDVNFAEQATIKKEAYDSEREALLVQGAQAINAGVESERGAAATAGRVYAGQQKAQADVRSAQADEMTNIESAILEEDSRLRDLNVSLDLEEVAGNQMKAANAQAAAAAAGQQGWQSVVAGVGEYASQQALYKQDFKAQQAAIGNSQARSETNGLMLPGSLGGGMSPRITPGMMEGINNAAAGINKNKMSKELLGQVMQMNQYEFKKWQKSLSPEDSLKYFNTPEYVKSYNTYTGKI